MMNSEMCSPGLAPGMKLLHLSMGKRFRYPVYQWLVRVRSVERRACPGGGG